MSAHSTDHVMPLHPINMINMLTSYVQTCQLILLQIQLISSKLRISSRLGIEGPDIMLSKLCDSYALKAVIAQCINRGLFLPKADMVIFCRQYICQFIKMIEKVIISQ